MAKRNTIIVCAVASTLVIAACLYVIGMDMAHSADGKINNKKIIGNNTSHISINNDLVQEGKQEAAVANVLIWSTLPALIMAVIIASIGIAPSVHRRLRH